MKTLTIFDLDDTIVHGDTSVIWRDYLFDKGYITDPDFRQHDMHYQQQYAAGTLNLQEYIEFSLQPIADLPTAQIEELLRDCIQKRVMPHIFDEAKATIKELIAEHGSDNVMIISATATFIVQVVAAELGISHARGVDLAIVNDRVTSDIVGIPTFREGKVESLKNWLSQQGKEQYYDKLVFYTDSINDLPLCEYADEVFTVNPCKLLRPIAEQNNWHILDWGTK